MNRSERVMQGDIIRISDAKKKREKKKRETKGFLPGRRRGKGRFSCGEYRGNFRFGEMLWRKLKLFPKFSRSIQKFPQNLSLHFDQAI